MALTDRKTANLQTSEKKYRHLFEHSPVGIFVTDRSGNLINVNTSGAELLGFDSPDRMTRRALSSFFSDPADRDIYQDLLADGNLVSEFETRLCKTDQTCIDVKIRTSVRNTLSGKVSGYESFIMDISELKFREEEHRKAEEKYKTVLENSLAGIYMFQDGGCFSYVNPELIRMMGYENDDPIVGRPFWEFIHPDDRDMVRERGLAREKGEIHPRHYPFRIIKDDGSIIWVDMKAAHATYMGRPAVVGNFIDITGIKQAQTRIRDLSRKLIDVIEEERKSLAADLHDEFGQGLTALRFDMEKLQQALTPSQTHESRLCSRVMEKISILAETIRVTTSKLRPDLLDHLGLVPALEWYVEDMKNHIPGIMIRFQAMGFKRRLSPGIEIALYRIFQESVNNILKHSGADEIDIRLTCSHPNVLFSCKDNGQGFETGENGFPKDDTMGIGLLSMQERADALNGKFEIRSVRDKGTMIRVEIPMQEEG
ncbi:MAG: PAS domain S-box protein [Pseudomonadota bacterium]